MRRALIALTLLAAIGAAPNRGECGFISCAQDSVRGHAGASWPQLPCSCQTSRPTRAFRDSH